MWSAGDRIIDPLRPGPTRRGFGSTAEALESRKAHYAAVREMFESAAVLVFTLGLTETWKRVSDGSILPLAPGIVAGTFAPEDYQFLNFGYDETYRDLSALIARVMPASA